MDWDRMLLFVCATIAVNNNNKKGKYIYRDKKTSYVVVWRLGKIDESATQQQQQHNAKNNNIVKYRLNSALIYFPLIYLPG
jgi:hypothetical protein